MSHGKDIGQIRTVKVCLLCHRCCNVFVSLHFRADASVFFVLLTSAATQSGWCAIRDSRQSLLPIQRRYQERVHLIFREDTVQLFFSFTTAEHLHQSATVRLYYLT